MTERMSSKLHHFALSNYMFLFLKYIIIFLSWNFLYNAFLYILRLIKSSYHMGLNKVNLSREKNILSNLMSEHCLWKTVCFEALVFMRQQDLRRHVFSVLSFLACVFLLCPAKLRRTGPQLDSAIGRSTGDDHCHLFLAVHTWHTSCLVPSDCTL